MPVSKDVVTAQLNALRNSLPRTITMVLAKKEIGLMHDVLQEGETIYGLASGTRDAKNWVIVATDRRVLCLDKGMFSGLSVVDLPIDKIQGVAHRVGMLLAEITITTGGATWTIDNVGKEIAPAFATTLAWLVAQRSNHHAATAAAPVAPVQVDVVAQLERLAKLKADGILTQAEFDTQKQRILQAH